MKATKLQERLLERLRSGAWIESRKWTGWDRTYALMDSKGHRERISPMTMKSMLKKGLLKESGRSGGPREEDTSIQYREVPNDNPAS